MKYSKSESGRIFILRLEDGEILQESIERFAGEMGIAAAIVQVIGGADKGSKLIVGPEKGRSATIKPMVHVLDEMHEIVGNGTIFLNEMGEPKLHCHIACGRGRNTICGEVREGVFVWHVMEVIITEIINCKAVRKFDELTGFELLQPKDD